MNKEIAFRKKREKIQKMKVSEPKHKMKPIERI